MEFLENAANEAQAMYNSIGEKMLFQTRDLVSITKNVVETKDFPAFLMMGSHIPNILRLTEVVSECDFQREFRKCVDRISYQLDGEKWYAITNHDRLPACQAYVGMHDDGLQVYEKGETSACNKKSGMFFLLLALSYNRRLRESLVGIVCAPNQFSMDCTGIRKKLVMFDDMSYTGFQASGTINQFHRADLSFVCPFIGTSAIEKLETTGANLVYSRVIKTYGEQMDARTRQLGLPHKVIYKMDAYPIWFHHKIADNISSFPEIYKHAVNQTVLPPYKNAEEYPNYLHLVDLVSRNFVFECNDETRQLS